MKAIVAVSGGIDSAVVGAIAKKEGYELYFLTVDYGQKNRKKELSNSKKLANYYQTKEHKIIDLTWLGKLGNSSITDRTIDSEISKDNLIYVPFRNTCIISACVAWAEVINADVIYTGSDLGPWIGTDNSPEYYKKLNELVKCATKLNKKVRVVAPLNYCDKTQIIKKGSKLKVPFEYTWTCVTNSKEPCGFCLTCKEREIAFQNANIIDPIKRNSGSRLC